MDLENKVIVITGASKGLGRELALQLAKEKTKLALVARSESDLTDLKKLVEKEGSKCEYFLCDVSKDKEVFSTVHKIMEKFGTIDILINNAGIWFEGKLEEHTPEKVRELFDTIALGTIYFSMAILPHMRKQKDGIIFNLVSVGGIEAPGEYGPYTPYTSAKYAVTGFSKALEDELKGTGVKVLGFYPAGMNTELFRSAGFNYKDNENWMMDKKDIAEIIVFILKRPRDISMDHVVVRKFTDN